MKVIALWIWFDPKITVQSDQVSDGSKGNENFHHKDDYTNQENSLCWNEEVCGSIHDGDSLLEEWPVAPKKEIEDNSEQEHYTRHDESSRSIFSTNYQSQIQARGSTGKPNKVNESNSSVGEISWEVSHNVQVNGSESHSSHDADDDTIPSFFKAFDSGRIFSASSLDVNSVLEFSFTCWVPQVSLILIGDLWKVVNNAHSTDVATVFENDTSFSWGAIDSISSLNIDIKLEGGARRLDIGFTVWAFFYANCWMPYGLSIVVNSWLGGYDTECPVDEWIIFKTLCDSTEVSISILFSEKPSGVGSESLGNTDASHQDHEHNKADDEGNIGWSSISQHSLREGVRAHAESVDGSFMPLEFGIELPLSARVVLCIPC